MRQSLQLNVSSRTVCRRWNEAGLKNCLCLRKPLISNKNKKKRLKFAKKHINKSDTFWNNVIWSDESKFELFNAKKRKRVWRKPNEGLKDVCIQSTVKHGGSNVLVWGCFSKNGVGELVEVTGIMTGASYVAILKENLEPKR